MSVGRNPTVLSGRKISTCSVHSNSSHKRAAEAQNCRVGSDNVASHSFYSEITPQTIFARVASRYCSFQEHWCEQISRKHTLERKSGNAYLNRTKTPQPSKCRNVQKRHPNYLSSDLWAVPASPLPHFACRVSKMGASKYGFCSQRNSSSPRHWECFLMNSMNFVGWRRLGSPNSSPCPLLLHPWATLEHPLTPQKGLCCGTVLCDILCIITPWFPSALVLQYPVCAWEYRFRWSHNS